MGHERLGALPKSQRWRDIVQEISGFDGETSEVGEIASKTLRNVQSRYRTMGRDLGVQAAFQFLVALASSCLGGERERVLRDMGIDLGAQPTPLSLACALSHWVNRNRGSLEYATLAQAAATDAITDWYSRQETRQRHLFEAVPRGLEVWGKAASGAGFCELARSFFAHLTRRYLGYFLEREASAAIRGIEARDRFQRGLREHVHEVSQHAFETARITQSFAAGWFNKNVKREPPDKDAIAGFLGMALGKMREELLREAE